MKIYRIIYLPKPYYLIQISKSGKWDGVRIRFFHNGEGKRSQDNWRNDLKNGIDKYYIGDSKNRSFINWKKDKRKGINIEFKR